MMVARGYAKRRASDCGCSLRAIVAISDGGDLQALICTDGAVGGDFVCMWCQELCQALNAALQGRNFAQAAALTPEHLPLDADAGPRRVLGLAVLHEAMLEAILEFVSMPVPGTEDVLDPSNRYGELAGAFH